jgi:hypothetical protein
MKEIKITYNDYYNIDNLLISINFDKKLDLDFNYSLTFD